MRYINLRYLLTYLLTPMLSLVVPRARLAFDSLLSMSVRTAATRHRSTATRPYIYIYIYIYTPAANAADAATTTTSTTAADAALNVTTCLSMATSSLTRCHFSSAQILVLQRRLLARPALLEYHVRLLSPVDSTWASFLPSPARQRVVWPCAVHALPITRLQTCLISCYRRRCFLAASVSDVSTQVDGRRRLVLIVSDQTHCQTTDVGHDQTDQADCNISCVYSCLADAVAVCICYRIILIKQKLPWILWHDTFCCDGRVIT